MLPISPNAPKIDSLKMYHLHFVDSEDQIQTVYQCYSAVLNLLSWIICYDEVLNVGSCIVGISLVIPDELKHLFIKKDAILWN